jgi:hypothetical protein
MNGKHDILKKFTAEAQMEYLEEWFRERHEDPINNCSGDGGYPVFNHGGPYEARDELMDEFCDCVPEEVTDAVSERLESECPEWSGIQSTDDYESDVFDVIDDPYENFETALLTCRTIADETFSGITQTRIYRLLYCSLITILEVYLCDAFKKRLDSVKNDSEILKKAFSAIKPLIPTRESLIRKLSDRHWQHFECNKKVFRQVFSIDLPDHGFLNRAKDTRHDIMHRDSRTKEGVIITITKQQVQELCNSIYSYVRQIEFPNEKPLQPGQRRVTIIGPGFVGADMCQ